VVGPAFFTGGDPEKGLHGLEAKGSRVTRHHPAIFTASGRRSQGCGDRRQRYRLHNFSLRRILNLNFQDGLGLLLLLLFHIEYRIST